MYRFRLPLACFFTAFCLVFSAFAQTPGAPSKIAFIDANAFYDKTSGITKLINTEKQLEAEFAARYKEVNDATNRLKLIIRELETMQKLPPAQINQTAYESKRSEAERLQRDIGFKTEDFKTLFNKRRSELMMPVSQDIGRGMEEFAKKNGYDVIIDISKLAEAVLYFNQAADITKNFIAFYNARPTAVK